MEGGKIVVGITAPLSVILIRGQLKYFADKGYKMYLLAPNDSVVNTYCKEEGCTLLPVNIKREINLFHDIATLWKIFFYLKKIKPDIINVGTPKMSLLGMVAAYIVGIKRRIYTCRGFRYEHERGLKRKLLIRFERLISKMSHVIICISPSVKTRGLKDNIFDATKAQLIGLGSSNGIDLENFNQSKIDQVKKNSLIDELNLQGKFVYGFIGRIVDRKGIQELYDAFNEVYIEDNQVHLVVVGKINIEQVSNKNLIIQMKEHPGISLVGFTFDVPLYISLFNVFVLPAWWEGFGNTLIQAAAMGVPVVSTWGTGCRDAVKDGYNGMLIEPKSTIELIMQMKKYKADVELRKKHGQNGKVWAKQFDSTIIWKGIEKIYLS